jgi:ribosome-associated translation inhibitor RaiA
MAKSNFFESEEGVRITITGQQEESDFTKRFIDEDLTAEIQKLSKIVRIDHANFHIEKHSKTGKRAKYTVRSNMVTKNGMFHAEDFAWDLTKAFRGVLHKLEREIIKKKGKMKVYGRAP